MRDQASKLKGLIWLSIAFLVAWSAVAGLPFCAKHFPWKMETKLADQVSKFVSKHTCSSTGGNAALAQLLGRLSQSPLTPIRFPVNVRIIRGNTKNAFASLGGQIFVYEGLFTELRSGEELAGVLAHEMEHVQKRHIMEGVLSQLFSAGILNLILSGDSGSAIELANTLSRLQFSRSQEAEADEGALKRLQAARIDPTGFQHFFERLEKENSELAIFSDHPSPKNRAERIAHYRVALPEPVLSAAQWEALKQICGLY